MSQKYQFIKVISFARNFGQTAALSAGVQNSSGTFIATLDGDLQNDPQDILPMLELCSEEVDIVSGYRKNRNDNFLRVQISKIANSIVSKMTGLDLHDYGCSMKVYRNKSLSTIQLYGEMHRFLPIYAHLKGAKVKEFVVKHHPRHKGVSKYGYQRILRVCLDIVLFYFLFHSKKPLNVFSKVSYFFAIITLLMIIQFLITSNLLFLVLFAISLQFVIYPLFFALILELIIRTHYLSQSESQFIIKSKLNFQHTD